MNKVDDEVIINDICDYAKKHKVKELLQEYLRRIIVDQPEDPVNGQFRYNKWALVILKALS